MNKTLKNLAVCLLVLTSTTACSEDKYVSVRHPEGESINEVTDANLEDTSNDQKASESTDQNANKAEENKTTDNNGNTDNEKAESDGVIYEVEDVVNVRLAPSEDSSIITQVEPGQDIIKLGDSDNWTRVSVDGQTGYIRSDLIKEK